jgi:hypothetical protein
MATSGQRVGIAIVAVGEIVHGGVGQAGSEAGIRAYEDAAGCLVARTDGVL